MNGLGEKVEGSQRDFFLFVSGWDKDSDFHVVTGTSIEPLPWHGMNEQHYGREPRPVFTNDAWIQKYNTRWVGEYKNLKSFWQVTPYLEKILSGKYATYLK